MIIQKSRMKIWFSMALNNFPDFMEPRSIFKVIHISHVLHHLKRLKGTRWALRGLSRHNGNISDRCLFERVDAVVRVLGKAKHKVGVSIQDLLKHKRVTGKMVMWAAPQLASARPKPAKINISTTPPKIPNQNNNQESRWPRAGDWLDLWAKPTCNWTRIR